MPFRRRRRPVMTALGMLAILVSLAACTSTSVRLPPLPSPVAGGSPASPKHPNIVFVLTDDLSWDLVKYMPHVTALQHRGMTFTNYTVTDSLCCPSRASIFTGDFPHNTHVYGNTLPAGGFFRFRASGDDKSTFATSLLRAGYRTGFMGKYLNAYEPATSRTPSRMAWLGAYVPPGWSAWDGIGSGGYGGFNFDLASGRKVVHYGSGPSDYTNTVLRHKATSFLEHASRKPNPFMLEVATFSPHYPYTPAPADIGTFTGVREPRGPNFDRLPRPAPLWMKARHKLAASSLASIRKWYRLRVEDVQSVDRMIGAIERTLQRTGQARNTVFVFSSDNGYHLGQYTLASGKQTAFDTDIRVPLIIAGPGIKAGSVSTAMAENIDLRPTFDELSGTTTPANVDGHSLVPLLHGQDVGWRTYALVEHAHDDAKGGDPDVQTYLSGIPPTYTAIRTKTFVFVRYKTSGDIEYYDIAKDPYELHNLGPSLSPARRAYLERVMNGLVACHGSVQCWDAGLPSSA